MKKLLLAATLLLGAPAMTASLSSCSTLLKGVDVNNLQRIGKVANVIGTANEITGVLGNTLGLNSNQNASLTDVFTNYINNTNDIASLAGMYPKSYAKELLGLNKGVLGKLEGILTAAQYAKLLGLGGQGASKSSLLDSLTGGRSLSSDATNVLSGLLLNGLGGLGQ